MGVHDTAAAAVSSSESPQNCFGRLFLFPPFCFALNSLSFPLTQYILIPPVCEMNKPTVAPSIVATAQCEFISAMGAVGP